MEVKIYIEHISNTNGNIDINLIDVWYKENYWTTSSNALGNTKTGPFQYFKGHRKAILWDGAGTAIMEIRDLDLPVYHLFDDRPVKGRAFYNVKDRPLRFGEHHWFQWPEKKR